MCYLGFFGENEGTSDTITLQSSRTCYDPRLSITMYFIESYQSETEYWTLRFNFDSGSNLYDSITNVLDDSDSHDCYTDSGDDLCYWGCDPGYVLDTSTRRLLSTTIAQTDCSVVFNPVVNQLDLTSAFGSSSPDSITTDVTIRLDSTSGFYYPDGDGSFSSFIQLFCSDTAPTPTPTHIPTDKPTNTPTDKPTANPTNKPTYNPSNIPTDRPSTSPTIKPSYNPTVTPSFEPTRSPNDPGTPTGYPSGSPSKFPTSPSLDPTTVPTNIPTGEPTQAPITPTGIPSIEPTAMPLTPTTSPTDIPTDDPTVQPTDQPSDPTPRPTRFPSPKPTSKPVEPGINATSIIEFEEGSSNAGGKSSAREGIITQVQEYILFGILGGLVLLIVLGSVFVVKFKKNQEKKLAQKAMDVRFQQMLLIKQQAMKDRLTQQQNGGDNNNQNNDGNIGATGAMHAAVVPMIKAGAHHKDKKNKNKYKGNYHSSIQHLMARKDVADRADARIRLLERDQQGQGYQLQRGRLSIAPGSDNHNSARGNGRHRESRAPAAFSFNFNLLGINSEGEKNVMGNSGEYYQGYSTYTAGEGLAHGGKTTQGAARSGAEGGTVVTGNDLPKGL